MPFEIFFKIFPEKFHSSGIFIKRGLVERAATGTLRQEIRNNADKIPEHTNQLNDNFQTDLHIVHEQFLLFQFLSTICIIIYQFNTLVNTMLTNS